MVEPIPAPTSTARPSGTRTLFAWPQVTLGAFDCWPDDERWRSDNHVDEGHLIAFPGTSVEIIQDGHDPAVTDPNQIVLYNHDQTYRRRLVASSGDHCTYLIVSPELLGELATSGTAPIRDPGRRPFSRPVIPISRRDHLEQRTILHLLASTGAADPLELQERLVRLVGRVLGRHDGRTAARRRRTGTEREHRRLAEDARAVLAADVAQPMSLDQLAHRIGTSVFHVSRVFREQTGVSLHAYRDELRLRSAVPQVLDGSRRLTDVALDHGYASPSHFTDRFRARYGVAPSRLRAELARGTRPGSIS